MITTPLSCTYAKPSEKAAVALRKFTVPLTKILRMEPKDADLLHVLRWICTSIEGKVARVVSEGNKGHNGRNPHALEKGTSGILVFGQPKKGRAIRIDIKSTGGIRSRLEIRAGRQP